MKGDIAQAEELLGAVRGGKYLMLQPLIQFLIQLAS
jgi:hypothetical protein